MTKVKESLRSVYSHKADRISQIRNSISKSLNLLILKQDTPEPYEKFPVTRLVETAARWPATSGIEIPPATSYDLIKPFWFARIYWKYTSFMAINNVAIFLLHCYVINDIFNRYYRLNRCRSLKNGLLERKRCKFSINPGGSTASPFCKGGSMGILLDSARAYWELTKILDERIKSLGYFMSWGGDGILL